MICPCPTRSQIGRHQELSAVAPARARPRVRVTVWTYSGFDNTKSGMATHREGWPPAASYGASYARYDDDASISVM